MTSDLTGKAPGAVGPSRRTLNPDLESGQTSWGSFPGSHLNNEEELAKQKASRRRGRDG